MNKAREYCKTALRKKSTPVYVKKQMRDFVRIFDGKDKKYKISEEKLRQVEGILKLLHMPKGLKAGQTQATINGSNRSDKFVITVREAANGNGWL